MNKLRWLATVLHRPCDHRTRDRKLKVEQRKQKLLWVNVRLKLQLWVSLAQTVVTPTQWLTWHAVSQNQPRSTVNVSHTLTDGSGKHISISNETKTSRTALACKQDLCFFPTNIYTVCAEVPESTAPPPKKNVINLSASWFKKQNGNNL